MKRAWIAVFTCILIIMAAVFSTGILSAMQCMVIKVTPINAAKRSVSLHPETLNAAQGDCVVWFNATRTSIKVTLLDGEKCASVSGAPVGFVLDEECFSTAWMDVGATASVRFMEGGTYRFAVTTQSDPNEVEGTINVE
ncbi:MAG: hypothetical protein R6U50_07005 [Desulfobacterales bacterium]